MVFVVLCWRVVGPTGSVFECSLRDVSRQVEVHLNYGENNALIHSRIVKDAHEGQKLAQRWLRTVLAMEQPDAPRC